MRLLAFALGWWVTTKAAGRPAVKVRPIPDFHVAVDRTLYWQCRAFFGHEFARKAVRRVEMRREKLARKA